MKRLILLTLPWIAALALFAAVQPERDSLAGLQPFPSRLKQDIHAVRDRASVVRELPVYQRIEEGFITEADLSALMKDAVADLGEEFQASLRSRSEAMRLMRLIGPGDDLETLSSDTGGTNGLAGFYFPTKKSLLVVGELESLGALQEYILAHEYIHSFQDQAFNLEDILVPGRTPFTERSITGQCVAEGDATVGAQEYMKEQYGASWERRLLAEALLAARQATPEAGSRQSVPATRATAIGLARYVLFVYQDCAKFVTALRDRDGWEGVNALYSRLPESSEQVLHPEKYFSGERPKPVAETDLSAALGSGWKQESSERFGEIDLLAYLFGLSVPDAAARGAAEGWGGGMMSVYANGDNHFLVHIRVAWDSAADQSQFKAEYQRPLSRLSSSTRQLDLGQPAWHWQFGWREMGYAQWDDATAQSDIVLTTSETAFTAVQTALSAAAD